MGDRVWKVPRDQFVAAWNGSESPDEAAAKVRKMAGGPVCFHSTGRLSGK